MHRVESICPNIFEIPPTPNYQPSLERTLPSCHAIRCIQHFNHSRHNGVYFDQVDVHCPALANVHGGLADYLCGFNATFCDAFNGPSYKEVDRFCEVLGNAGMFIAQKKKIEKLLPLEGSGGGIILCRKGIESKVCISFYGLHFILVNFELI